MSYPVPVSVYEFMQENPESKGSDITAAFGIPGRTARRYAKKCKSGEAYPVANVVEKIIVEQENDNWVVRDEVEHVRLNAAIVDIETTDFSATGYGGILVCCSFFPLNAEKPYTISLKFEDKSDDKRVLQDVIAEMNKYDILIGHYIFGYDLPWLNTRADVHHLPPLRKWFFLDTYLMAKQQRLKTDRKSLAFLVDHFGIEGTKTAIYPRAWNNIRSQNRAEFEEAKLSIVTHCELDVEANRNLFDRLFKRSLNMSTSPLKSTYWSGG